MGLQGKYFLGPTPGHFIIQLTLRTISIWEMSKGAGKFRVTYLKRIVDQLKIVESPTYVADRNYF